MSFRCALLNCQGLVTKRTNKLKSAEFQHIHVMSFECWTNQFSEITVNNFGAFVLNKQENKRNSKRKSGGIILYIRNK